MLNRNAAARSTDLPSFGLDTVLETQARLWNHFLDANRSLWTIYAPWLQAAPWFGALAHTIESDEADGEAAKTANGVPDVLESQTRAWNHLIDANRQLWTTFSWPVPAVPWPGVADTPAETARPAQSDSSGEAAAPARRPSASKSKARKSR